MAWYNITPTNGVSTTTVKVHAEPWYGRFARTSTVLVDGCKSGMVTITQAGKAILVVDPPTLVYDPAGGCKTVHVKTNYACVMLELKSENAYIKSYTLNGTKISNTSKSNPWTIAFPGDPGGRAENAELVEMDVEVCMEANNTPVVLSNVMTVTGGCSESEKGLSSEVSITQTGIEKKELDILDCPTESLVEDKGDTTLKVTSNLSNYEVRITSCSAESADMEIAPAQIVLDYDAIETNAAKHGEITVTASSHVKWEVSET